RLRSRALALAYSVLLPTWRTFLLGPDRLGASLGAFSLSLTLHLAQQVSVIVKGSGQIGMVWPKGALNQCQSTLVKRCSLSVLVLGFVHPCEVVQSCGRGGMVWANGLLKEF